MRLLRHFVPRKDHYFCHCEQSEGSSLFAMTTLAQNNYKIILCIVKISFYNTLTRRQEIFKPLKQKTAGLYTCGPTVYQFAHLGNLRTYIFEDLLRRVLIYNCYKVKHVMNITDVGHLTSDADTGEDKIEQEAKKEGKNAWEIARFYTDAFQKDIKALNILKPTVWCRATDHIAEMINLIGALQKKGFIYQLTDGLYFDTSKLKNYGYLARLKKEELKAGARIEIAPGKKNPTDFAVWKFSPKDNQRQMEWNSPWGKGFPGWHIECSAMSMKYLGQTFDIHCGGIDHIPVHHSNEIAQSEAATGKKFVNYWLHGEFLILDQDKMAKSKGQTIRLLDITEKGFNPLVFRYLCLNTRYRSPLVFSWESLTASQNALNHLYESYRQPISTSRQKSFDRSGVPQKIAEYESAFQAAINNDLNLPQALAIAWQMLKDKQLPTQKRKHLLLKFDAVLGLDIKDIKPSKIPLKVIKLLKLREKMRQEKNWPEADRFRRKIEKMGYLIEDTPNGPQLKNKKCHGIS